MKLTCCVDAREKFQHFLDGRVEGSLSITSNHAKLNYVFNKSLRYTRNAVRTGRNRHTNSVFAILYLEFRSDRESSFPRTAILLFHNRII